MATIRKITKGTSGNENESITKLNLSYGESTVEIKEDSIGIVRNLHSDTATIQTANIVNSNASNSSVDNMSTTNLTATNIVSTVATITNIDSTIATITNINATDIVTTNLTATNITATLATITEINFDTEDTTISDQIGAVTWNNTDKCLNNRVSDDVIIQLSQEVVMRAVNKTGSTISNSKLVYISGASGNRPKIDLATTNTYTSATKMLAMATEDITNNEYGFVTRVGIVRGINTQGITEGTELYLDTDGDYTITKPTAPTAIVKVGKVIKEHVDDGWIQLCIEHDKSEFGDVDSGNYSYFEADGTLVNVGEATTWDDLPPNPIIRSRIGAVNNPTLGNMVGNVQQYIFDIDDYVVDNLEFIHSWNEGTDISPHIHWVTNGSDVDNRDVAWELEYSVANAGVPPTATIQTFSTTSIVSVNTTIPANTADRSHFISAFPTASLTGYKIGAIVCYNIKRITADGTAPSSDPFGIQVSGHYQKNTQGSRDVYTK